MAKILVNLPETLTPSQKSRYFKQLSGRDSDSDLLCRTIEKSSLCTIGGYDQDASCVKVLSPPVKQCTSCTSNLIENHRCRVKLYTLAGMYEAEKVTLQCVRCKISYNYDKWGDKIDNGFRYYPVVKGVCGSERHHILRAAATKSTVLLSVRCNNRGCFWFSDCRCSITLM